MSEMSPVANETASSADFEFQALQEARNYRAALVWEFREFLKGNVIEIGAGIGQITRHLLELSEIEHLVSVEPDPRFCAQHREQFPDHELIAGGIETVPPSHPWDAILSINVLEHIEKDELELAQYAQILQERRGVFCLLVPARKEIYAPIDRDFGHFRRYDRRELRRKLETAGFEVIRLDYFNAVGYFAWWLNFCLLQKREFERNKVRFYDRVIFPVAHFLEANLLRPPFGQSLIAVARSR